MSDYRARVILEAQIADLQAKMRQAQDSLKGVSGEGRRVEGEMRGVGSTIMGRVVPAVAGLVSAQQLYNRVFKAGFDRLADLEDARKRMEQMGLSTDRVSGLMDGLTDTVTGTAFALNEGASIMAGFVSAGMPLDKVNRRLAMTADTAAFALAPLGEIGNVFLRIQSEGKLTGETLNMLQVRGVPALEMLADAAGVSGAQMRAMVSENRVDAERFFDLWDQGSRGFGENMIRIEGAAKSMGDVTSGSLANARTAFARLGATILETTGAYEQIGVAAERAKDAADLAIDFIETLGAAADRVRGAGDDTAWWQKSLLQLNSELDESNEKTSWWNKSVFDLVGDLRQAANNGEWWAMSLADIVAGTDSAGESTGFFGRAVAEVRDRGGEFLDRLRELNPGLEEFEGAARDAEEAVLALRSELFESANEALNLEDQQDRLAAAIGRAAEAAADDEATKRGQRSALRDVARESIRLIDTMIDQRASTEDVRAATESARKKFIEVAVQMGLTRADARRLADQYGLIPEDVKTTVELLGAERVRQRVAEIRGWLDSIKSKTVTITARSQIPQGVSIRQLMDMHTGGEVTPTGIRRFHSGGTVGGDGAALPRFHDGTDLMGRLASDEVPAILQTGELVLSRDQRAELDTATRAMSRLMGMMGRSTMAGPVFHQGGPVAGGMSGPGGPPLRVVLEVRGNGGLYEQINYGLRQGQINIRTEAITR